MKKLSCFVVGLLLFSGFAIIGIGNEADEKLETVSLSFLELDIIEKDLFVEIEVEGSNNHIFSAGKPMLPVYTETLILPFGAKVNEVLCEVENVESRVLTCKVLPAPEPQIKSTIKISTEPQIDEIVYTSNEIFPNDWYSYHVGVGLDENMEHKTLMTVNTYPVRYNPAEDTIFYARDIDLKIKYENPDYNPFPATVEYDMVIISPETFSADLQPLIDHKNSYGVETILKSYEEILDEYTGIDEPEKIKYFIKDALEEWGVTYVLLVGGLKNMVYAKPRDDENKGVSGWHLPVRYSNLDEGEPGYCCDHYFADIYKEGGIFDNWDSNNNGIFAEWTGLKKDTIDLFPDVAVGRLACRNDNEVKSVVDKIITYETGADSSWFEKMIVVSGDGFLDQEDLNFQWDTNGLPEGEYTIYAQTKNPENQEGPKEEIHVTIDRSVETKLTFNHEDHLKIENYPNYPYLPIAEIVTVADGDILGNTDFSYRPDDGEAYLNSYTGWANMKYEDGVLYIRGKNYDPKPYGVKSDIRVWIKNSAGEMVFEDERLGFETYFEGEWTTGDRTVRDRGGVFYYMPSEFDREYFWTSNGNWETQTDVINAFSQGCGFIFFSGHGSPGWWGNHFPGIPGNRRGSQIEGLLVFDFHGPPFLPMEKLTNEYKTPICVVGGCHNSMFNISLIPSILDRENKMMTHTYGRPTPECWTWYLTRISKRGAIACMGNTGYGYGNLGDWCNAGGVDNWITTEFFVKYAEGHEVLGDAYAQALTSYVNHFRTMGIPESPWDSGHEKTVQQWVLHGDPSLKMGGYPTQTNLRISNDDGDSYAGDSVQLQASAYETPNTYIWDLDNDGEYDDATGEEVTKQWADPGVYWVSVKAIYDNREDTALTIVDILNKKPNKVIIDGPKNLNMGQTYTYTVEGTDPDGDELFYLVEWGDETYTIIEPDDPNTVTHKWAKTGSFDIKLLAIDSNAEWAEETLRITISKNKHGSLPLLQFIHNMLEKYPNLFPLLKQIIGLVN